MNNDFYSKVTGYALLLILGLTMSVWGEAVADQKVKYWVAPMDPNYQRDKPGKSPMGMDLVPVYKEKATGSSIIIAPEVVQNLGIRTVRVKRLDLAQVINTVGYIGYDERKVSHIHLRVPGWIDHLSAHSEGERFNKGDTLFTLYSPELVNAQQDYIQLLGSGNKRLIRAGQERLEALGVDKKLISQLRKSKQAKQLVPTYAEHKGVVSNLSVRHGMYVTPDKQVMSLADLSSVWVLIEVFENQANWVKQGDLVEMQLDYLPGRVWQGKVEYIYPSLSLKTRSLKVRLHFDNPGELLKPNMFARVKIFTQQKTNALVVPVQAVIQTGVENRIIVNSKGSAFEPRRVQLGIESGENIEILSGLEEGEEVVLSGQFLIDSEANLQGALLRMQQPAQEANQ